MSEHIHGKGLLLSYSITGSGGSYTLATDRIEIDLPEGSWGESDDTDLDATDRLLTASAGWLTLGDLGFTAYFHETQYTTLHGYWIARRGSSDVGNTLHWRIEAARRSDQASSGHRWVFAGWIKTWKYLETVTVGDQAKLRVRMAIKPTGIGTLTAGA